MKRGWLVLFFWPFFLFFSFFFEIERIESCLVRLFWKNCFLREKKEIFLLFRFLKKKHVKTISKTKTEPLIFYKGLVFFSSFLLPLRRPHMGHILLNYIFPFILPYPKISSPISEHKVRILYATYKILQWASLVNTQVAKKNNFLALFMLC